MTSFTFYLFFIPLLAVILLAINFIFATYNPNAEKRTAFECGFHSFLGQNRSQFSISFFIFALLFLLFDLEILLIYPYALSSNFNDIFGLLVMLIFFILLTIGFIFELGKKALVIYSRQNRVNVLKSALDYPIALFISPFFIQDVFISLNVNEIFGVIFNLYTVMFLVSISITYIVTMNYNIIVGYVLLNRNKLQMVYLLLFSTYLVIYMQQFLHILEIMDVLFKLPSVNKPSLSTGNFLFTSGPPGPENPDDPDDSGSNNGSEDEVFDCTCGHNFGEDCSCNHVESFIYAEEANTDNQRCCYCGGEGPQSGCYNCDCAYHNSCHYGTDNPDSNSPLRENSNEQDHSHENNQESDINSKRRLSESSNEEVDNNKRPKV